MNRAMKAGALLLAILTVWGWLSGPAEAQNGHPAPHRYAVAMPLADLTLVDPALDSGTPAVWAALGDSITYGTGTTDPATKAYPVLAGIEAYGNPGQCLVGISPYGHNPFVDDFVGYVNALPVKPRVVVVEIGINDVNTLDATLYQMKQAYRSLIAQGLNLGVRVVLSTITPQKQNRPFYTSAMEDFRIDINTWMRATYTTNQYVDFAAALRNTNGYLRDIYDSGDGLHPNNRGAEALAAKLMAARP